MAELNQPGASFDRRWVTRSGATSRGRASGVRLGSMPANSQEDVRFVQDSDRAVRQDHLPDFGDVLGGDDGLRPPLPGKGFPLPARASHAVGTLLALAVWLTGRRVKLLSPNALQMLDVGFTLGVLLGMYPHRGVWRLRRTGTTPAMLAVCP